MHNPKFFWLGCWAFWGTLICLLLILHLFGCAAVPKYYDLAEMGYNSPEGIAAQAAMKAAAGPIAGHPWGTILGSLAGIITGGYAVYKRKKWIDSPPPAQQ